MAKANPNPNPKFSLFKLLIQPVIAEHNEEGRIINEQAFAQPSVVYGFEGVEPYLKELREQVEIQNAAALKGQESNEQS